jgi:GNAT superfamily N-acetyltransferase
VADIFIAVYQNQIIGFCAIMQSFGYVGQKRIHRLVIIPDFQGIGIGTRLLNFVAHFYSKTHKINITTGTPALSNALKKSPFWRLNSKGIQSIHRNKAMKLTASSNRPTFCFTYKKLEETSK